MTSPLTIYAFRHGSFAPGGDTAVCVGERTRMEAVFGRDGVQELFDGKAVFTNDALKLDYLGVWGVRNASRLRRLLREQGVEVIVARTSPPDARLRYFSHSTARLKRRQRHAAP